MAISTLLASMIGTALCELALHFAKHCSAQNDILVHCAINHQVYMLEDLHAADWSAIRFCALQHPARKASNLMLDAVEQRLSNAVWQLLHKSLGCNSVVKAAMQWPAATHAVVSRL